jgi:hypothetical protein
VERRRQALLEEDPTGHGGERQEERHHDRRMEQARERRREPSRDGGVRDDGAEPERQQRVHLLHDGLGSVRTPQEPERAQLLFDHVADVLDVGPARDPLAQIIGDLLVAASAIDRLQHPVEQRRQLDRLTVGATHERGGVPIARASDHPEHLDALRARRCPFDSVRGGVELRVNADDLPARGSGQRPRRSLGAR